jgi:diguanylate cyclase (GGDEF)-like protein
VIEYDELKALQVNAVTDPLTGLYNRRLFSETFEKELNRARRYGLPLGLVVLDLHRFKEVNDKHGHPLGDEVLRAAATTLRKALRTSDSAFRIGGDEFALLLLQTDAEQALALSRRVETVFAETVHPLRLSVPVNMDHGVATFPQDGEQAEQLIRIADERLYRLKRANHGTIASASTATPASAASSSERPAPPPPISIETKRAPEGSEPQTAAQSAPAGAPDAQTVTAAQQKTYAIKRKAERVSMAGTNAYATLGEQGARRARVIDLGFGGVAIELDNGGEIPDNILAVLHVPILPPVRVSLKPVWSLRTTQGSLRVGCAFVS